MRAVGLLAHQGGWDEILLVAGPIVVIAAVLAIVKRRVDARASDDEPG
jgi:predicted MFS family arabinose efflux permease